MELTTFNGRVHFRPHQSLVGKTPAEIYWGREVARKAA